MVKWLSMKKIKLLLVLSALSLSGCDFLPFSGANKVSNNTADNQPSQNTQNSQNNAGNTGENQQNTSTNTGTNTGSNTGTNTGSNTGTNTGTDEDPYVPNLKPIAEAIPDNTSYPLSDYTDFAFHEGHEPTYHDDWSFYYGTSLNPSGRLWKNPNEKLEASGIDFIKNTFLISPLFDSWKKVEIRFNFWFSAKTSDKYKATSGQPQFILEGYNLEGEKVSTQDIQIERSDVPNNNTSKWFTQYIKEPSMRFFVLRWNNYIPNGNSGYSAVICDAKLKGWDFN